MVFSKEQKAVLRAQKAAKESKVYKPRKKENQEIVQSELPDVPIQPMKGSTPLALRTQIKHPLQSRTTQNSLLQQTRIEPYRLGVRMASMKAKSSKNHNRNGS